MRGLNSYKIKLRIKIQLNYLPEANNKKKRKEIKYSKIIIEEKFKRETRQNAKEVNKKVSKYLSETAN